MSARNLFAGEDLRADIDRRVVTITLDRPPVNALRTQTWAELGVALTAAAGAPDSSVLLLRSRVDGIFSAGADVKELPMNSAADECRAILTRSVLTAVGAHPVPVLAVIDGPVIGGACALVSQADVRLGTTQAAFALPEIDVGRCGGARHLMRHLDQGTVRWMAFTGRSLSAERARAGGLLTMLVEDADKTAAELAECVAGKSPTTVRMAKQALDLVERMNLVDGYAVEQQFSLRLAHTPDAAEAAAAFREKRPARYRDLDDNGEYT